MKRKKERIYYRYQCTLTGDEFSMTEKAPHADELVSVEGYYQLHPDKDDRPAVIKKQLALEIANRAATAAPTESDEDENEEE